MPHISFCGGREHKATSCFFFLWILLEFNFCKNCQHLTNWTRWNKRSKVWSSATSLFKWRFRSRRHWCCLSFPRGGGGGGGEVRTPCTLPLDPPLQKAAIIQSWLILYYLSKCSKKSLYWKLVPSLPAVCRVANWNSKEASPCAQRAGLIIRRSWVKSLSVL